MCQRIVPGNIHVGFGGTCWMRCGSVRNSGKEQPRLGIRSEIIGS